ncbi:unnamed protein product [Polarella glacialis]|uniref:Ammonium transporter AmtB-like domain-containing protein n=1 Tax=Polarella glacialis TaxID=89957 RepID=A0A813D8T5_POLGL|nr:unnamed protein product [Polarella glacialis]
MAGISAEDSAYVTACTGLVLFMTPGLALFYGGLVRQKAATDMMLQNCVALGLLSMLWYVCGFSMSFGAGTFVGDISDHFMWSGVSKHTAWPLLTISSNLFATFQMMFAIITPILMTGTFADRMHFGPYLLFLVLWSALATCKHKEFLTLPGASSFTPPLVGLRSQRPWHWVPARIVLVGTGILWFGWFGFNGGSALAIGEVAITAVLNSHLAAAAAVCVWGALDWYPEGKPKLVPLCIACVAGLVVVTPSAGFIQPANASFVGMVAGFVCWDAVRLLNKSGIDDALDVWGVHRIGGATGTILLGILADGPERLENNHPEYCVNPNTVARGLPRLACRWRLLSCACCGPSR